MEYQRSAALPLVELTIRFSEVRNDGRAESPQLRPSILLVSCETGIELADDLSNFYWSHLGLTPELSGRAAG